MLSKTSLHAWMLLAAISAGLAGAGDLTTRHHSEGESPPPGGGTSEPAAVCENGFADQYPCHDVDLMARVAIPDLGAGIAHDLWGWTDPATGMEAAIVCTTTGMAFVDVSDPAAPVVLGTLPAPASERDRSHCDVKVFRNHAFIVGEAPGHGLQVFDLRRLRHVEEPGEVFTEDGHYRQFGNAHNVAIDEETGFAYAVGSNTCAGGLHMIDVRTPEQPRFAGCFSDDGYTHDVECVVYRGPDAGHRGDEVCFASNEDTVTIVDVTDKSAPRLLSRNTYADASYTHQGWLTEDQAYFLLDDELDELDLNRRTRTLVWDVRDLERPVLVGFYEGPTKATDHNLYVLGEYVFEANYKAGVRILHLDDVAAARLSEVAYFDTYPQSDAAGFDGAWTAFPYFHSGTVIVSAFGQGLFILRPTFDYGAAEHCLLALGSPGYCAACGPCAADVGDCATDDDCADGLSCAESFGAERQLGFSPRTGVCVAPGSWTPAPRSLVELESLGSFTSWRAVAANNAGQIAGTAGDGEHSSAFRFSPDTGLEDLDPDGAHHSQGLALTERGAVYGTLHAASGQQTGFFLYSDDGGFDDLDRGATRALRRGFTLLDVNDDGDLVGVLGQGGTLVPYRYTAEDGWSDLSRLDARLGGRSTVAALAADDGRIVLTLAGPGRSQSAFLITGKTVRELGDLGGGVNAPAAIGTKGRVVGLSEAANRREHAYLYAPAEGLVDLHPDRFRGSYAGWVTSQGVVGGVLQKRYADRLFTWDERRAKHFRVVAGRGDFRSILPAGAALRGIEVVDMNERGEAVGRVLGEDGGEEVVRFFYFSVATGVRDVQALLDATGSDAEVVEVVDLDDWGVVLIQARRPDARVVPLVLEPI